MDLSTPGPGAGAVVLAGLVHVRRNNQCDWTERVPRKSDPCGSGGCARRRVRQARRYCHALWNRFRANQSRLSPGPVFKRTSRLAAAGDGDHRGNHAGRRVPVCIVAPRQGLETNLSLTVADLMSSDVSDRLRAVDFAVVGKGFTLPCSREETRRILSDVLTAALQTPEVKRVSIYGGARPGVSRLIVAAHCVWPPPLRRVITIGKRDEDCEPATFPGWPLHSGATGSTMVFFFIFSVLCALVL